MNSPEPKYNGFLPVNKPIGPTSHDVVQQLRRILKQRRVGHTGTLDPLAGGLMLICLGKATKLARFISNFDKTYVATISLGRTSRTFDAEGLDPAEAPADLSGLKRRQVEALVADYVGIVRQRVPAYSAVKVDGQRLYKTARKGLPIQAPERDIEIKAIDLIRFEPPTMEIRVACSTGTYIRSLADDIGRKLGCGAYLKELERTQVGHLKLEACLTLDNIEKYHREQELSGYILKPDEVLDFGAIEVRDEFARRIASGRHPGAEDILGTHGAFDTGDRVFLKDSAGRILAVGTAGFSSSATMSGADGKLFQYIRVLN